MAGADEPSVSPRDRARSRRGQADDIRRAAAERAAERAVLEEIAAELASGPAGVAGLLIAAPLKALRNLAKAQGRLPENESVPPKLTESEGTTEKFEGELFVKGGGDAEAIDMNDVDQNQLGDCYFMALLAAIARVRPDVIEGMVSDNGDGTYTVTFHTDQGWFSGLEEEPVTVDNLFWQDGGKPIYAGVGDSASQGVELWAMVIEKAWAQLHGGYGDITGGNVGTDARVAVTGHEATTINPSALPDAVLLAWLNAHFTLGHEPVVFGTPGEKKIPKGSGVSGDHAYALKAVDVDAGTVSLYNPWGHTHVENIDMTFLKANFDMIRFVQLDAP